jgi:hypothetical protein
VSNAVLLTSWFLVGKESQGDKTHRERKLREIGGKVANKNKQIIPKITSVFVQFYHFSFLYLFPTFTAADNLPFLPP